MRSIVSVFTPVTIKHPEKIYLFNKKTNSRFRYAKAVRRNLGIRGRLSNAGIPLRVIQEISGHCTLSQDSIDISQLIYRSKRSVYKSKLASRFQPLDL